MYEDAFSPLEPLDELPPHPPPDVDVEVMLQQLEDRDPYLRMQAARAFCDLEEPRAVQQLLTLVRDPCPLVRVGAAYALGRNPDPGGVEVLIEGLRWDWNGYVRKGLVWALGNAKDPRAYPVLMEVLANDITAVRLWAASALGQLAQAQVLPCSALPEVAMALCRGLAGDPVAPVRGNCAWSLGILGQQLKQLLSDPDADQTPYQALKEQLLLSASGDPDWGVRDDARLSLQKLADPGCRAVRQALSDRGREVFVLEQPDQLDCLE
ncbi:HEAT repeat domain-containing protein [Thermostichus vulcanus]|uniref:HEAT repeat domain-containing protein n=1 Tax=Thermostichus vulcanus str. 'Rupite' TaxID=2813851 RepID=A0ABT0C7Q9_THEVL|nr:HEAT repeat domain-containing protein [Thermostichus vulcanus]MCJ2541823.1 HEAT repeat domain-containing protein [Thermostichus vulcanus str. 'Rupite']